MDGTGCGSQSLHSESSLMPICLDMLEGTDDNHRVPHWFLALTAHASQPCSLK